MSIHTLVEALHKYEEPIPKWLDGQGAVAFDKQRFFASRTVYYPGCADDEHPIRLCAQSRAAHLFVYVDKQGGEKEVMMDVRRQCRLYGYKVTHTEPVAIETLCLGGWEILATPDEDVDANGDTGSCAKPYALFIVLTRKKGWDEDHGPRRLAILFVGGDGFATYNALYCQSDGTRAPFMILLHRSGFAHCGRDSRLEEISMKGGARPDLLLVSANTEPWRGYCDVGAEAEEGGMNRAPRKLFRRRTR